jgi:hypothetical protein
MASCALLGIIKKSHAQSTKHIMDACLNKFLHKHIMRSEQTHREYSVKTPLDILTFFDKEALVSTDAFDVLQRIIKFAGSGNLEQYFKRLSKLENIPVENIWAILLNWLLERLAGDITMSRQAGRLLRELLRKIDKSHVISVRNALSNKFSTCNLNLWSNNI